MKRFIQSSAEVGILRQFEWYAERGLADIARQFRVAVAEAVNSVVAMPSAGAPRPIDNARLAGLRTWPVNGFDAFRVYYLPQPDLVTVIRILHDKRDFETKLAEADKVQPGRGLLVFCLSGLQWHRSELEDFADFYLTGRHRKDDSFAKMEADALRRGSIELKRNITALGFVQRRWDSITEEQWIPSLRGPSTVS